MKRFALTLAAVAAFSGSAGAADIPAASPQIQASGGIADPAKPAAQNLPRLVDLGASKCVPCKMMAPILDGLKEEYAGRMDVEFIDVWKTPEAGRKFRVRMIPTQIFYGADGMEIFRHEGFFGKEDILAKWKELGVDLSRKSR